jgi:hypothetical protein
MASQWISVHNSQRGVTLTCPDAPLFQIGDFNFGRLKKSVPRDAGPLLLAWPMNNYYNTNFRVSQPGFSRVRYELVTHGPYDPVVSTRAAIETDGVEIHPVVKLGRRRQGRFVEMTGDDSVFLLHMKSSGALLANVADKPATATIGATQVQLQPRSVTTIRAE